MKKIILSFVFVLAGIMAFAQAELAVGVKGGLNFAKLDVSSSASANYNNRTGYHAGAFVLVKLSKIAIQPEILFSKQGSTVKINTQDLNANYSYINIPVLLKLYTIAGINIQVGPQFGFVASAKQDIPDPFTGKVTSQDVKNDLKKADLSAALGLGWDLPLGLSIDARYNLGLSKINNDQSNNFSAKNQVFQVSVGYKLIKLGK